MSSAELPIKCSFARVDGLADEIAVAGLVMKSAREEDRRLLAQSGLARNRCAVGFATLDARGSAVVASQPLPGEAS